MRRFLFLGLLVSALLTAGLCFLVEGYGKKQQPAKGDVIIVLGAAVWEEGPSPAFRERLLLAARLYGEGYAPYLITTGGSGSFSPVPEGEAGKDFLVALGLPPAAILAETSSLSTRENLKEAQKIMREKGWERAIIVTHDFHLLRALRLAKRLGMEASGAGVQETVLFRWPHVLREAGANLALTFDPRP